MATEKQERDHVNGKLSESEGAPARPTGTFWGEFVTETFEYNGGRLREARNFGVEVVRPGEALRRIRK